MKKSGFGFGKWRKMAKNGEKNDVQIARFSIKNARFQIPNPQTKTRRFLMQKSPKKSILNQKKRTILE
jgi:hypothetical protein